MEKVYSMSVASAISPELVNSLNKLRRGSSLAVISFLMGLTGLIMCFMAIPALGVLLRNFTRGYGDIGEVLENLAEPSAYLIIGVLLLIGSLIFFLVAVLGDLVSGCDGLARWDPSFITGARIYHGIRSGIILMIAGSVFMFIGIFSPLAIGILLIVLGVLSIVAMMNVDIKRQVTLISAIPEVFIMYLGAVLILFGILGVVFRESPISGLMGGLMILIIGIILTLLASTGLAIVFIHIGRIFRSTSLIIAGILTLLIPIVSFIIVSMEIPVIIHSLTSQKQ